MILVLEVVFRFQNTFLVNSRHRSIFPPSFENNNHRRTNIGIGVSIDASMAKGFLGEENVFLVVITVNV